MAATLTGMSLSSAATIISLDNVKLAPAHGVHLPWKVSPAANRRLVVVRSSPATPSGISEKVSKSIEEAEKLCAGDAESGECVAAWDEVEELSAAASHAREKLKETSDPLEAYCKDNPETDECRTYED